MTAGDQGAPVKSKAYLLDPETLEVVWMNESAADSVVDVVPGTGTGIETIMPMAESLGIPAALRAVAEGGMPRSLRAEVISTAKGSMGLAISIYRLPDGMLLMLAEHAWRTGRDGADETRHRSGRGRR